MSKTKFTALILLLFVIVSGMCTADGIKQEHSRYYGFSVLFRQARYQGEDEEVFKDSIGEPLGDAANYRATRYKNKWCDCVEFTEKDTARVYRDTGSEDFSSIIVLTDTGTYIRAYDVSKVEYNPDLNILPQCCKEQAFFLVKNTDNWRWTVYGSLVPKCQTAEQCEKLLRLLRPYVNQTNLEGFSDYLVIKISFESDSTLKMTLYYSVGEWHTISFNIIEHMIYAENEQFLLSEDEYREWMNTLTLDENWFLDLEG